MAKKALKPLLTAGEKPVRRKRYRREPAVRTPNGPCCEENCWREAYIDKRCKRHHDEHVYKQSRVA